MAKADAPLSEICSSVDFVEKKRGNSASLL
jgi:hypothetical protein